MGSLVAIFEKKLSISRGKAIKRVVGFIFCIIAAIGVITSTLIFFPYHGGITKQFQTIPGEHVQVPNLSGDVLVEREQFLKLAENNTTFIAPGRWTIAYMTKLKDVSFEYDQSIKTDIRYERVHSLQTAGDDIVNVRLYRDSFMVTLMFIVVPLLLLFVLFIVFALTTYRWYSGRSHTIFD